MERRGKGRADQGWRSTEKESAAEVAAEVGALLHPIAAQQDLIVEGVTLRSNPPTLEIVVDKAEGTDPVGIDEIAEFSRAAGTVLDEHDPIPGAYALEVTTRGADAPLLEKRHYLRNVNRTIRVKLGDGSKLAGTLEEVGDDSFALRIETVEKTAETANRGTEINWIRFDQVKKARPVIRLTSEQGV